MRLIFSLILLGFMTSSLAEIRTQGQLAELANGISLWFSVESNILDEAATFSGSIQLINHSSHVLTAKEADWQIYLHMIRRLHSAQPANSDPSSTEPLGLVLEHVQGDLHRIRPTMAFKGLAPGESLLLPFQSAPWIISYSDFMPRAFIVAPGLKPEIFANTDTEQFSDFVRPLERPEQLLRNIGDGDKFATMTDAKRYQQHQQTLSQLNQAAMQNPQAIQQRIIPSPQQVQQRNGHITLHSGWQLVASAELQHEGQYLQQQLQPYFSLEQHNNSRSQRQIRLALANAGQALPAESYQLEISEQFIDISGADAAGVFYGIQSLLALLPVMPVAEVTLPLLQIRDQPRYHWRGMHYDMARNFHGLEVTLQLIEQMARYKLNKLHLHLTEDEGWRLEIPDLPELTEIGAYRCFDLTEQQCLLTQLGTGPHSSGSGNGYYSRQDFIQILRHARDHHIEVIPEIDMPGHARAAVKAMEARYQRLLAAGEPEAASRYLLSEAADTSTYLTVQNYNDNSINVCLQSSYAFVDKVIAELQQMYIEAQSVLRVLHMGGDEVGVGSWLGAPACQQLFSTPDNGIDSVADLKPYFINRVAQLTAARGLALAAWEDGLMATPEQPFARSQFNNPEVIVNAWDNIWEWGYGDRAYVFANAGYAVVQSPGTNLYFDHPQEAHPEERGYYWAARYTDTQKVFFYRPDHLYSNAEFTRDGSPIADLAALLGRALPPLKRPENMLGIQGQLWSETIRSAEQLEQMLYPRLLALAERAWHRAPWEPNRHSTAANQDWLAFSQRLVNIELPRLQHSGVQHYLPPPGAIREGDTFKANRAWPNLILEYSLDQGQQWQPYQQPLPAQNSPWLRSRSGGISSRVISP